MNRPVAYPVTRGLLVLALLLVMVAIVLGTRYRGPLHALGPVTDQVTFWFQLKTEVLFA